MSCEIASGGVFNTSLPLIHRTGIEIAESGWRRLLELREMGTSLPMTKIALSYL